MEIVNVFKVMLK